MTNNAIKSLDSRISKIQQQLAQLTAQPDLVQLQRELDRLLRDRFELLEVERQAEAEKEIKELLEKREFNRKKLLPILKQFVADYNQLLAKLRDESGGWIALDTDDREKLNVLQGNPIPPMPLFRLIGLPQEVALVEDGLFSLLAIGEKIEGGYMPAPMPAVPDSRPFTQPNFMPIEQTIEHPNARKQMHPANLNPFTMPTEQVIEFPAKKPAQATDGKSE